MIAKKNLCELDFENDTEHNYILYTDIMPDDKFKIIIKEKLDKLKSLIDRYENFFPNGKGILKYLIKAYTIFNGFLPFQSLFLTGKKIYFNLKKIH